MAERSTLRSWVRIFLPWLLGAVLQLVARRVVLIGALVGLLAVGIHASGIVSLRDTILPITAMRADTGHAAIADIRVLGLKTGSPAALRLRLYENDREIGPGGALHDDVRKQGEGRYSVWGDWLIYSASDATNPATNGRSYVLRGPAPVPIWLAPVLLLVLAWAGRLYRAETWRWLLRGAAQPVSLGAAGLFGVAILAWSLVGAPTTVTLKSFEIAHRDGKAYVWRLSSPMPGLVRIVSDSVANPEASGLQLREYGQLIGPPHTAHLYVGTRGGGHFSHWGEELVFSSSDNSDPRRNGRSYQVSYRHYPSLALLAIGAALLVAALAMGWRRLSTRADAAARKRNIRWALTALTSVTGLLAITGTASRFDVFTGTVTTYTNAMEPAHLLGSLKADVRQVELRRWAGPFLSRGFCDTTRSRVDGIQTLRICPDQPDRLSRIVAEDFSKHPLPVAMLNGEYLSLALNWSAAPSSFDVVVPLRLDGGVVMLLYLTLIGLAVLTIARNVQIHPARNGRASLIWRGRIAFPLVVGGMMLLGNIWSMFQTIRAPNLTPGVAFANYGPGDFTLDHAAARAAIPRRIGESDEAYAHRLTLVVADAISHVWWSSMAERLGLRVPITENLLLWAKGGLVANQTPYIFVDPDKALERGVGACGQVSVLLAGLLQRSGVKASTVMLDGHGLVSAEVRPGVHHLLDPDFAAVIPFDFETARANPAAVRPYYQAGLERMRVADRPDLGPFAASIDTWLDIIEAIYRRPGGRLATIEEYVGEDHVRFERLAYQLKWPIPIALILLGLGLMLVERRRLRERDRAGMT